MSIYRQLFGGQLGYRLERTFTSYPSFLGITVKDSPFGRTGLPLSDPIDAHTSSLVTLDWGYADDNVIGYDNPTVLLFRNVEWLPVERLVGQLAAAELPASSALKFSNEDWQRQQAGGTWAQLFNRESIANRVPVLAWLVVVEVIYLAALPFCLFLFRPLADRGMVLARTLGLIAVAYVTWIIVSLGLVEFSVLAILVGLLVVAAASAGSIGRFPH